VLKNRGFSRAARKGGLTDRTLCGAVTEIEAGLIDAQLGGSLLKKRIGKGGRGKSGGFRTIAAYRQRDRLVFLYVFGKNERDNITEQERVEVCAGACRDRWRIGYDRRAQSRRRTPAAGSAAAGGPQPRRRLAEEGKEAIVLAFPAALDRRRDREALCGFAGSRPAPAGRDPRL
jgi:hypothetical protein